MVRKLKALIFTILVLVPLFFSARLVLGDDSCPICSPESSQSDCEQRIACLSNQKQSLSAQIDLIDTQIRVTQSQIESTQAKIDRLTSDISSVSGKITVIEDSLAHVSTVLANRIVKTYIAGRDDPVLYLLGSTSFDDFWQKLEYLRLAQKHDKNLMIQMAETRKNYNDQKNLLEDKKKQVETLSLQLQAYKLQLNQQNKEKQALLAMTQEELDQAIAQLAAFQNFVNSQPGGASLLSNQTKCDDWGCYYNQRDTSWGATAINHTGYPIAYDGCLLTSMAMVATHYGRRSVTPLTINGIPSNFAIYPPAYLNYPIDAGGSLTREKMANYYSSSSIDGELSAGHPVVVGIDPGPSHFVVLVSGSGGDYTMNDPYVENGSRISFTSRYSLGRITEIDKVHQ